MDFRYFFAPYLEDGDQSPDVDPPDPQRLPERREEKDERQQHEEGGHAQLQQQRAGPGERGHGGLLTRATKTTSKWHKPEDHLKK